MKILYFLDAANLNGSELHLLDLVQYMKSNNEVTVITFKSGALNARLFESGITQVQLNVSWQGILSNLFIILDAIKNFKPEIIHSHQPKAILYGGICSKILLIPSVITIHSKAVDHSLLHKIPMNWLVHFGHSVINFISQILASKIIFVNRIMLKESFFQYKAKCIYNWLSPIHDEIDSPNKLSQSINILSVGSISYGKGTDLLLDLFDLIKQDSRASNFTFTLDVVGTGDAAFVDSMVKKSNDKSLGRVNFLGYLSNTSDYYKQATIFMLLSRSETFGLVYVEAMNYGLPIFSLNIDVLEEVVPDWNFKSDDLFELKERFFELISSVNLYQEISKKNIEYSSVNFSYIKSMRETYKVYQELL